MALTAQEIYARDVRDLPSSERLRLAAIILQDLTRSGATVVEQSESLRLPSTFRSFFATLPPAAHPTAVGRLSERDWNGVRT